MDAYRKKLLWRATHRGTKEMDILLGTFARENLPSMNAEQLKEFEEITKIPDITLTNWLTGKEPVPKKAMSATLESIRRQVFTTSFYKSL